MRRGLIRVSEHLVLLVSHGGPDLRRHEALFGVLAAVTASLIAPYIVQKEDKGSRGTSSLRAHDCQLGRSEIGRIASLEGLRSNNIAQRERAANNGGGEGTLGSTANVGDSPLYPFC